MRPRCALALPLLLLTLAACATGAPADESNLERIDRLYVRPLAVAAGVHREGLRLTKQAYDAGLLDDAQLERAAVVGRSVEASLRAAKESLLLYLDLLDPASEATLEERAGQARALARQFEQLVLELVPRSQPVGTDGETE